MAGSDNANSRQLDRTPTWAVATVVAIIIIVSFILEKVIHRLGEWFTHKHKKALFEALEKVKGELMVLGFISLILTFSQVYIARICIPYKAANTMLPCPLIDSHKATEEGSQEEHRRRLLWNDRRFLAGAAAATTCKPGHVPLISVDGLHQLHIFIFFLAVVHVVYSALTMMFGRLKIRGWKEWEKETSSSNDPARFRLTHETSFVRAHTHCWTKIPVMFYIVSFFRQFFRSVRKTDYLTMRHGFIAVHLAHGSKFNFQKYIRRSLEDDFKVVVGISPALWATVVIFLLLNVNWWVALIWASIIPLVIILAVGTKLQAIITQMAIDIHEKHPVIQGIPLVQVSDNYFWFSWPPLVLHLIHFVLFQNAFHITYYWWIWYEFGLNSCFNDDFHLIIISVVLRAALLVLCSYITLPLYALVSQMGSNMKRSIFNEQTSRALKNWHKAAIKKTKHKKSEKPLHGTPSALLVQSLSHPLHHLQTTAQPTCLSFTNKSYSEKDMPDLEGDNSPTSSTANHIVHNETGDIETEINERPLDTVGDHEQRSNEDDLPFAKPALVTGP